MNKTVYMMLLCTISLPLITTDCKAKTHFKEKIKKLYNQISGYKEEINQKEYPALSIETIFIHNIHGPITIKTGWKKDLISLKTTARAKKEEDLNNIKIIDSIENNHINLKTKHVNSKLVGLVEYELIVPASLNIKITVAGDGDVIINDVHGSIDVVANDAITITNSKQLVSAHTLKKGPISIINATGPVETRSHYGNISGENIANSFSANSTTGKISVSYKTLPSTSSINLETISGNIMLALPTDTNAEIRGHTTYGTLISDHYITLKPYTTQLNTCAWNKFKKEVDGILGTGEATIALHSTNGNVKITENKTT